MNKLTISTTVNIDLEFQLAPFHKRLLAWLIDFMIFILYIILLFKFLPSIMDSLDHKEDGYWLFIILLSPIAFYHVVLENVMGGQTLGKKLFKLRVIHEFGGNATISQFIIRWMLRVSDLYLAIFFFYFAVSGFRSFQAMSFVFLVVFTDLFCMIFTKKQQRLGDMAASTILIDTQNAANLNDTVFMEIADNYVPRYPAVMKLSDRDLNLIKNIYDNVMKRGDYELANRTAAKIATVLKIDFNQSPLDFLETVLKDYNYLSSK